MKKINIMLLVAVMVTAGCDKNEVPLDRLITEQLDFAVAQYKGMQDAVPPDRLPRTIDKKTGELVTSGPDWWTCGFFPGTLWYLYEYTGEEELRAMARERTALINKEQYNTGTHDLGFMLYNSYGKGYRLTGDKAYRDVLVNGAYSLKTRYNNVVGCIRSWDHGPWTFPVIIDNMMNLEYLVWAARATGDASFIRVALSHADKTLKNHYRKDYSSFHLVDYDTLTGKVITRETVQGVSDSSAWARGQAWGFYGFVTMYRYTRNTKYLQQAVHIADFILHNPRFPEDGIPYWDFNDPDIPETYRDASAAAILASGLVELSRYVDAEQSGEYLEVAERIVRTLSSPAYRASPGGNQHFLLKHSVGNLPGNSEVDVPLTYADYYFVETLMRLRALRNASPAE